MGNSSIVCSSHGEPSSQLKLVSTSIPVPRRGQVLVRMLAAPVNPSDLLFVKGNYQRGPQLPATIGFEGVGIVEKSGGGLIGRTLIGKRVAVLRQHGGTWANYCVSSVMTVIPVPQTLSNAQAAAYFVNPATALMLTQYVFPIPVGNWLIQSAAASSLGRMIIRLGKHYKFRTINLVRNPDHVNELKQLGADEVLVVNEQTSPEQLRQQVWQICLSASPRYAVDPVGGSIGSLMLNALGEQGRLKTIAALSDDPLTISARTILINRLGISSFWLDHAMKALSFREQIRFVGELGKLHAAGLFQVENFQAFPLHDWRTAIDHAGNAPGGTKVILTMQ
ncbi:MAG TPA: zinc-dependent alcohol dehydrogenase family protein [Planctomicrobium sp.]|nr:zinc-dependent alcohol dehydrogenase family protein [Planctomicrobium sp.]